MSMGMPNFLTSLRTLSIPLIVSGLQAGTPRSLLAAGIVFLLSMATDALDGYFARKFARITVLGTVMDPIADKMLMLSVLFLFADLGLIPLWTALVMLFREFFVSGLRQAGGSGGTIIGANWMGKTKTALQTALLSYAFAFQI